MKRKRGLKANVNRDKATKTSMQLYTGSRTRDVPWATSDGMGHWTPSKSHLTPMFLYHTSHSPNTRIRVCLSLCVTLLLGRGWGVVGPSGSRKAESRPLKLDADLIPCKANARRTGDGTRECIKDHIPSAYHQQVHVGCAAAAVPCIPGHPCQ